MKDTLARLTLEAATKDPKVILLTGDHGHALWKEFREKRPDQFINCGIAEQSMIGIASGLAREGYTPIVYGLASFVPMRVLEQIKLDICLPNLHVIFIGDGAGLVYSHMGPSHQCAEDMGALMPLPNIQIYSPWSKGGLEACYDGAHNYAGPSYLRVGRDLKFLPIISYESSDGLTTCIIATGSMVYPCAKISEKYKLPCFQVSLIKPLDKTIFQALNKFSKVIVVEEHSKHGGLYSSICQHHGDVYPICLEDKFSEKCGSYNYALSEHKMDDANLELRIVEIVYRKA